MNVRFLCPQALRRLRARNCGASRCLGQYIATDLLNESTGFAEAGDEMTPDVLETLENAGIKTIPVLDIDHLNVGAYLRNTLAIDKNNSREDALMDIYRVRPSPRLTTNG